MVDEPKECGHDVRADSCSRVDGSEDELLSSFSRNSRGENDVGADVVDAAKRRIEYSVPEDHSGIYVS